MRILCVCLGNICRSPMAEAVLRAKAKAAGLDLAVDSAGTGDWHVGNPPDQQAILAAEARGYDIAGLVARQTGEADYRAFDLILGMDDQNVAALRRRAPDDAAAEIALFHPERRNIPDPYGLSQREFERSLDMIEASADALVARLGRGGP